MTNKENWNPGHSTHKGYPYAGIASHQTFPNRPKLSMGKEKNIFIEWDIQTFPNVEVTDQEKRTPFEDFLLFRLFDFQSALDLAEGQVEDLLTETPFMPEKFGFEVVLNTGRDIHEPPMQLYMNKYDQSFSLTRTPGDSTQESFNPAAYTLLKKKDDGTFGEISLSLPCARIAYAALYSLGVKMVEDDKVYDLDDDLPEDKPNTQELSEKFGREEEGIDSAKSDVVETPMAWVDFKRGKDQFSFRVSIGSEDEMFAEAKNFIETHRLNPYKDVLKSELVFDIRSDEEKIKKMDQDYRKQQAKSWEATEKSFNDRLDETADKILKEKSS